MRPSKMRQQVVLRNPGPLMTDPVTGNERPGPPTSTTTRAYLAQVPVGNVGAQIDLRAEQDTVVSLWTLLVPPDAPLTRRTTVISGSEEWRVVGEVANRPMHRPQFLAAALRKVSDLQGGAQ